MDDEGYGILASALLEIVDRDRNAEVKGILTHASSKIGRIMEEMIRIAESRERTFNFDFQKALKYSQNIYQLEHLQFGEIEVSIQGNFYGNPRAWLPLPEWYTHYGVGIQPEGHDGPWVRPSDLGMEPGLDEHWQIQYGTEEKRWEGMYVPARDVQRILDFLDPPRIEGYAAGR